MENGRGAPPPARRRVVGGAAEAPRGVRPLSSGEPPVRQHPSAGACALGPDAVPVGLDQPLADRPAKRPGRCASGTDRGRSRDPAGRALCRGARPRDSRIIPQSLSCPSRRCFDAGLGPIGPMLMRCGATRRASVREELSGSDPDNALAITAVATWQGYHGGEGGSMRIPVPAVQAVQNGPVVPLFPLSGHGSRSKLSGSIAPYSAHEQGYQRAPERARRFARYLQPFVTDRVDAERPQFRHGIRPSA